MLHTYVRYRDVVLRVVRCLPDVAGAGRVEDKCVVEIPADSAWRGLDPAPLRRHLRVVPMRVLRLGNHWCSLVCSRIDSLSIPNGKLVADLQKIGRHITAYGTDTKIGNFPYHFW